jgi:rubrerythrin
MIAPRNTSYNSREMDKEGTVQAVLALLSQRQPVSIPRWVCDVCGMIHTGATPLACESCGNELLTQQSDLHCEMNSHW